MRLAWGRVLSWCLRPQIIYRFRFVQNFSTADQANVLLYVGNVFRENSAIKTFSRVLFIYFLSFLGTFPAVDISFYPNVSYAHVRVCVCADFEELALRLMRARKLLVIFFFLLLHIWFVFLL